MSTPLEGIVRPFAGHDVFPTPFTKPGQSGVQLVRIAIGFQGAIKTMGYSMSVSESTHMGQIHQEEEATRAAAKAALSKAAATN